MRAVGPRSFALGRRGHVESVGKFAMSESRPFRYWPVLLVLIGLACNKPEDSNPAGLPCGPAERMPSPYPPGAWRALPRAQLRSTVLWFSQILVRHVDGDNARVSLESTGWSSVLPPPARERLEAMTFAQEVRQRAREAPQRFGELAREFSEDLTTRNREGSMGAVPAAQLERWPTVLDALWAIRPGEPSHVVETRYGFHVFMRREVPAEERITGAHVVIGHAQAPWLASRTGRPRPRRSRAEALAIAQELYEVLSKRPERFDEVVVQRSEHPDSLRGGDFGTWTTREPWAFPRELQVLLQLRVGEIAPPIDTRFGIQILRRMPNRIRHSYAMRALRLRFRPEAEPEAPDSRRAQLAEAQRLALGIARGNLSLQALLHDHCCDQVEQWEEGRGAAEVTALLDELQVGEVASRAVQAGPMFVIPERVAPQRRAKTVAQFP